MIRSRASATPNAHTPAGQVGNGRSMRRSRSRGFSLAWFAGAEPSVLGDCPTEQKFYNAIGLAVLLTALSSGVSVCLALSYTFNEPPTQLWPVGLVWAVFIGNTDRLLVSFSASRHRLLALVPRVLLSLLIACTIGEVLMLRVFAPEINNQMQVTIQLATQRAMSSVSSYYGPKMAADQAQIATIEQQENQLRLTIDHYEFMASCEVGAPSCSTTHLEGEGPYFHYDEQRAAATQAELTAQEPQDQEQLSKLSADEQTLRNEQRTETTAVRQAAANSRGLIAREDALAAIESQHPGVRLLVWIVRLILITADLIAITIKSLRMLFSDSPYEAILAARQDAEALRADRVRARTAVKRQWLHLWRDMHESLNRVRFDLKLEHRISEEYANWEPKGNGSATSPARNPEPFPLEAPSLGEYVSMMRPHEAVAVSMPRGLRRGAWIGTGLIAALVVGTTLSSTVGDEAVRGWWMAPIALVGVSILAASTRGFRRAPPWALRASFGTLLLGFGLPLLLVAINI